MSREDEELLKALTSDTRRNIVRTLSEGDRNPTDLSRLLKKSKSTIVEHLEKLMKAGLVEKNERPGHKWVFYSLTRKGESYVSKKSQRLVIILSSVFLSIIGGVFSLVGYLGKTSRVLSGGGEKVMGFPEAAVGEVLNTVKSTTPWLLYLSIGLFVLALIGIFVLIIMKKKRMFEV